MAETVKPIDLREDLLALINFIAFCLPDVNTPFLYLVKRPSFVPSETYILVLPFSTDLRIVSPDFISLGGLSLAQSLP